MDNDEESDHENIPNDKPLNVYKKTDKEDTGVLIAVGKKLVKECLYRCPHTLNCCIMIPYIMMPSYVRQQEESAQLPQPCHTITVDQLYELCMHSNTVTICKFQSYIVGMPTGSYINLNLTLYIIIILYYWLVHYINMGKLTTQQSL